MIRMAAPWGDSSSSSSSSSLGEGLTLNVLKQAGTAGMEMGYWVPADVGLVVRTGLGP